MFQYLFLKKTLEQQSNFSVYSKVLRREAVHSYTEQFLFDLSFYVAPSFLLKQELRAHLALVTRQEELGAKSSYGMSSNKILRINKLIKKEKRGLIPVRI